MKGGSIEFHYPGGYNFLGPGTDLNKRRFQKPFNKLDAFAKEHDLAYEKARTKQEIHKADKIFEDKAWSRVKDSSAKFIQERIPAYLATNLIKLKRKLGLGMKPRRKRYRKPKKGGNIRRKKNSKRRRVNFKSLLSKSRKAINKNLPITTNITRVLSTVAQPKGTSIVGFKRVIPIPKSGGILPLVPILGALSAAGLVGKSVSSIVDAVSSVNNLRKSFQSGKGIYAQPSSFYKNKGSLPSIGKGIKVTAKGRSLKLLLPLLAKRIAAY